ncbi:hypothetical protein RQP46_001858 [Phenoliferia psychrophenolica]
MNDVLRAVGEGRPRWKATVLQVLRGSLVQAATREDFRSERDLGGIQDAEELGECLALVETVLAVRAMETTLPDPMARSVLNSLLLYRENRLPRLLPIPIPSPTTISIADPTPTPEQLAIINSPTTPGLTRINAFAGSAKTWTLAQLALEEVQKNPDSQILCLSYNRGVCDDAQLKFWRLGLDDNVTCRTTSKLALDHLRAKFGEYEIDDKVFNRNGPIRSLYPNYVAKLLDLQPESCIVRTTVLTPRPPEPKRIVKSLENVAATTSTQPEFEHLCESAGDRPEMPRERHLSLVRRLWSRTEDLDDTAVPLLMDQLVNLCLRDPDFRLSTDYDLILFDEAQDSNAAEQELVRREAARSRVVLCGDQYQAIYLFRGADNAWATEPVDLEFSLTKSYRFGSPIDHLASDLLTFQGESRTLRGSDSVGKIFRPDLDSAIVRRLAGRVMLFRSNRGLLNATLQHMSSFDISSPEPHPNMDVRMTSGRWRDFLKLLYHARRLALGTTETLPEKRRSPRLARFKVWSELASYARFLESEGSDRSGEDYDIALLMKWESFLRRKDFYARFRVVKKASNPKSNDLNAPTVTLALTHQVKGLEFPHVVLADDFTDSLRCRLDPNSPKRPGFSIQEEMNIQYVAVTRAEQSLTLNPTLFRLRLLSQGLHQFHFEENSLKLCGRCHSEPAHIHYSTPFPHFPSPDQSASQPSQFPICLSCAEASKYKPLKDYGTFWANRHAQGGVEDDKVADDSPDETEPFSSFKAAAEDPNLLLMALEEEVDQDEDFWKEGEEEIEEEAIGEDEDEDPWVY